MKTVQNQVKRPLQYTQVVILTLISTAAARGRDTTTLGLFKERSPSVPITPHFTFHISSRLSGPLDRSQFIFPSPFLCTHNPSVTHIHTLLRYMSPLHSSHFLFSQSLSQLSFSVFSLLLFLHPLTFLHSVSLQGIASFFLLLPLPAVFDSSLRIRGYQGF